MSENQKRVLQMLAEGKISVEEASRLLALINKEGASETAGDASLKNIKPLPKYLYVRVEPKEGAGCDTGKGGRRTGGEQGKVNIRIPMELIRAGIKLKALIPPHVVDDINKALQENGIGFDIRELKDDYLENLITALGEAEINVDSEEAEVRIHAE
jgi:hypothetical protein